MSNNASGGKKAKSYMQFMASPPLLEDSYTSGRCETVEQQQQPYGSSTADNSPAPSPPRRGDGGVRSTQPPPPSSVPPPVAIPTPQPNFIPLPPQHTPSMNNRRTSANNLQAMAGNSNTPKSYGNGPTVVPIMAPSSRANHSHRSSASSSVDDLASHGNAMATRHRNSTTTLPAVTAAGKMKDDHAAEDPAAYDYNYCHSSSNNSESGDGRSGATSRSVSRGKAYSAAASGDRRKNPLNDLDNTSMHSIPPPVEEIRGNTSASNKRNPPPPTSAVVAAGAPITAQTTTTTTTGFDLKLLQSKSQSSAASPLSVVNDSNTALITFAPTTNLDASPQQVVGGAEGSSEPFLSFNSASRAADLLEDEDYKELSTAPDGRTWYSIYTENCTSEVARSKGINDRSLFYCICVRNPFRTDRREPIVDERDLLCEDDVNGGAAMNGSLNNVGGGSSPTLANGGVPSSPSAAAAARGGEGGAGNTPLDDFAYSIRPGMAANDHATGTPRALKSPSSPTPTTAAPAAGPLVGTSAAPKAFLLDDDLIRVFDYDAEEDRLEAEEKQRKKNAKLQKEKEKLRTALQQENDNLYSPSPDNKDNDTKADSQTKKRRTAGNAHESHTVPNDFQKVIELVWRLSQRGVDVYPINMIQKYRNPQQRHKMRLECPYEALLRQMNASGKPVVEVDKDKKKKEGAEGEAEGTAGDSQIGGGGGGSDDDEDDLASPILGANKNTPSAALLNGGGAPSSSSAASHSVYGASSNKKDAKKAAEALAKAEKKERKRLAKHAKQIEALKKEFPNLGNYEANKFHGMRLAEEYCYLSPDKDEIYIKIHARTDKLIEFAEAHSLPLISHEYSPAGGSAIACTAGVNSRYSKRVEKFSKSLGIPKDMREKNAAFHFGIPHKMRMMDRLLREPWEYGGCGLQINEMIGKGILITSFFPLHNQTSLVESGLLDWASFKPLLSLAPLAQDENAIVSYFGEQIALYFLWIQEMTFFLRWLAVPGMITGVFSAIDFYKSVANASFALCCVVWGGFWCIWWTRKEKEFAILYCQEEQSAQQGVRDEFVGKEETLKIVDVYEMRFSHPLSIRLKKLDDGTMVVTNTVDDTQRRRRIRYLVSYPIIILITLMMIAVMILITWWRFDNVNNSDIKYASSIITTVVSALFGVVFSKATEILNDLENLRTHNDMERQNIQKSFLFSFFSSYFSLFIIALYPLSGQSDSIRLNQLESQMIIICLVNPMIQNMTESILPNFNLRWRLESDLRRSKLKGLFAAIKSLLDFCSSHKEEKEKLAVEREKLRQVREEREAKEANESQIDYRLSANAAALAEPISKAAEGARRRRGGEGRGEPHVSITIPPEREPEGGGGVAAMNRRRGTITSQSSSYSPTAGATTPRRMAELNKAAADATAVHDQNNNDDGLLLQRYFNKVESTRENARAARSSEKRRTLQEDLVWDDERAELWYQAQLEPIESTSGDYLEITLQFGFMAMCASSFPWAAVAALFYNLLELRLDAIKMVHFMRRPMCRTATDIGPWKQIFVLITLLAVVTNAYLVFIIGDTTDEMNVQSDEAAKWKSFIIMQYIAVFVIISLIAMVGTTPTSALKVVAKRAAVSGRAFQRAAHDATITEEEQKKIAKAKEREVKERYSRKKYEHLKRKEQEQKRAAKEARRAAIMAADLAAAQQDPAALAVALARGSASPGRQTSPQPTRQ